MTYDQHQFILRLSKNVEDYLKIAKANEETLKSLGERFEAHIATPEIKGLDPMSNNQTPQEKKENSIMIESEIPKNDSEILFLEKAIMNSLIQLCGFLGIKKIEVVYNKYLEKNGK